MNPVWIAGALHTDSPTAAVHAPWDGTEVGRYHVATAAHVEAATQAAVDAFPHTRALPSHVRRDFLRTLSERIKADTEAAAQLLAREAAKPITMARIEIGRAVATFALAAEEATRLTGETLPLDVSPTSEGTLGLTRRTAAGPVVAIAPFNFPLNLVAHKLAPAFALGAPVVLKPAAQTPLSALRLAEHVYAAADAHKVPKGILSVVAAPSEVAQTMVEDARFAVFSFTGSDAVGWKLRSLAGRKRTLLELGGNAAVIVHEDADVDACLPKIVAAAFGYAGQVCIKVQRVFVHERHHEAFLAKLIAATMKLSVGDPMDEKTTVSAVIDEKSATRIRAWIDEALAAGATLHVGGERDGNRIAPAVLTGVKPGMKLHDGEVFGPVVTVHSFTSMKEAIEGVNASRYGLQTGIFSNHLQAVMEAYAGLDVGGVIVNDAPTFRVDAMPYGGVKDSGLGREGVRYAIEEMSETRLLVLRGIAT